MSGERPRRPRIELVAWPRPRDVLILVLVAVLALGGLTVFNVLADPLGVYRESGARLPSKADGTAMEFLFARYGRGKVIWLGSSVSHLADPDATTIAAGRQILNLAGATNTAAEQALAARLALRGNPGTQTVWWELFMNVAGPVGRIKPSFLKFAYDDNVLNDVPYLVSLSTALRSVSGSAISNSDWPAAVRDYHACTGCVFGADSVAAGMARFFKGWELFHPFAQFQDDVVRATMRQSILPLVRERPDVTFVFFFPPISAYAMVEMNDRLAESGSTLPRLKSVLMDELRTLPNVEVHDLQTGDVIEELSNYMDLFHYRPEVNTWVAKALASGTNRTNPQAGMAVAERTAGVIERNRARYTQFRQRALSSNSTVISPHSSLAGRP